LINRTPSEEPVSYPVLEALRLAKVMGVASSSLCREAVGIGEMGQQGPFATWCG
jgi:hypothetical protein